MIILTFDFMNILCVFMHVCLNDAVSIWHGWAQASSVQESCRKETQFSWDGSEEPWVVSQEWVPDLAAGSFATSLAMGFDSSTAGK